VDCLGNSYPDGWVSRAHFVTVEVQCLACGFLVGKGDEGEPAVLLLLSVEAVFGNRDAHDLTAIFEKLSQVVFLKVVGQPTHMHGVFALHAQRRLERLYVDVCLVTAQIGQLVHLLLQVAQRSLLSLQHF